MDYLEVDFILGNSFLRGQAEVRPFVQDNDYIMLGGHSIPTLAKPKINKVRYGFRPQKKRQESDHIIFPVISTEKWWLQNSDQKIVDEEACNVYFQRLYPCILLNRNTQGRSQEEAPSGACFETDVLPSKEITLVNESCFNSLILDDEIKEFKEELPLE